MKFLLQLPLSHILRSRMETILSRREMDWKEQILNVVATWIYERCSSQKISTWYDASYFDHQQIFELNDAAGESLSIHLM